MTTLKDLVHSALNPTGWQGGTKVWYGEAKPILEKLKTPSDTDEIDPETGERRFIDDQELADLAPLLSRPITKDNFSRRAGKLLRPILTDPDKYRIQGGGTDPVDPGDGTTISPPNAARPVHINGSGWPVLVIGTEGKPQNSTIEEGFYRTALQVSRGYQSGQGAPGIDAMNLQQKAALAKNALDMIKLSQANETLDGLSADETKQLRSSAFTTLWYLFGKAPQGSQLAKSIHQGLVKAVESETNKFFGRSMVEQMLRSDYQGKLSSADRAEVKELFGEKFGDKFDVKNILDDEGYVSWEHVCGHGEGFYDSFVQNLKKKAINGAKFEKVGGGWDNTEFELTFDPPKTTSDGTPIKGMRLNVRNFHDDMFDSVGQRAGFSYGGHSGIGANQENSAKNAILKGLKANSPQLAVLGLCAGLDNLDDDLKKFGDLEVLTTFDSSYFWKGQVTDDNGNSFEGVTKSEDMEALMAVWEGLVEGDDYERMEQRVEDKLDQFWWIDHNGVDPNYVFPTLAAHRQVRWMHLDGDDDGRMDAGDVFFQFGLKKAQKDSANDLVLKDNGLFADDLVGDDLKNAVLDYNVATHYNSTTSDNSTVVHKFMADGYFDGQNSQDLIRVNEGTNPHDGSDIFKVQFNSNLAHSTRSALEALAAYASTVEMADEGNIHGLDETDRKLMGLTFATFALNYDDKSRFNDQRVWKSMLKALDLPSNMPYGPLASLVDNEHHDYSGNMEIVNQYKNSLSAGTLEALKNAGVGRGYKEGNPNIA